MTNRLLAGTRCCAHNWPNRIRGAGAGITRTLHWPPIGSTNARRKPTRRCSREREGFCRRAQGRQFPRARLPLAVHGAVAASVGHVRRDDVLAAVAGRRGTRAGRRRPRCVRVRLPPSRASRSRTGEKPRNFVDDPAHPFHEARGVYGLRPEGGGLVRLHVLHARLRARHEHGRRRGPGRTGPTSAARTAGRA